MKQLSFVLGVIYFLQFSLAGKENPRRVFLKGLDFVCYSFSLNSADEEHPLSLTVLTVATQKTDGYRRFMQYAQDFNLSVEVSL